jgi:L-fucose mutarotase
MWLMLRGRLIHPQILHALGRAGHNSRVLISDSNYPHWSKRGPNAEVVFLNIAPGLVSATDVLSVILSAIPVEAATVMDTLKTGPYAMATDPPVWAEFRSILDAAGMKLPFVKLDPQSFYAAAGTPDVVLTVATGEQRLYSNLLLTIGAIG